MNLGNSQEAILEAAKSILRQVDEAGKLVPEANQIHVTMNGYPATIRAYFSNTGELMSLNIFPGRSSRGLGNVVEWS